MRRGIITFESYLKASQIAFSHPTKIFTTHNDLNWESSIYMANMLWSWSKFKKNKKWRKGFKTFFCIFFGKRRSSESNGFATFIPSKTYNISTISNYNLLVYVMVIVKPLNNNQWSWFKVKVTIFVIAHIWAFRTFCCVVIFFPSITSDDGLFEFQGLFKHNDFGCKSSFDKGLKFSRWHPTFNASLLPFFTCCSQFFLSM